MGRLEDIRQERWKIAQKIDALKDESHRLALEAEEWDDQTNHWVCCGTKLRPGS